MDCTNKKDIRVVYGDYTLGVHGEGYDYIFSYAQGGLESIVKNGYEWLYRCPKPTFWRALTDNDRGSRFHIKSGSWLAADMFIDCKDVEVIMDGISQGKPIAPDNNKYGSDVFAHNVIVKYIYETVTTPATTIEVIYDVADNGRITVNVLYKGAKGLPELPVFGLRFIMPTLADKYMYKGLSGETYPDRMAGAVKGVYEIDDLSLTPYLVPQECGMRMDTDWLEVTRHTSLNNSRKDSSAQILRIKKMEIHLHSPAFLIQQMRLRMQRTMKNCHLQEEQYYACMEQSEVLEVLIAGGVMLKKHIISMQKRIFTSHSLYVK